MNLFLFLLFIHHSLKTSPNYQEKLATPLQLSKDNEASDTRNADSGPTYSGFETKAKTSEPLKSSSSKPEPGFDPETDENVEHKAEKWNLINGEHRDLMNENQEDQSRFNEHPAYITIKVKI